jgi:hypothetical protein
MRIHVVLQGLVGKAQYWYGGFAGGDSETGVCVKATMNNVDGCLGLGILRDVYGTPQNGGIIFSP